MDVLEIVKALSSPVAVVIGLAIFRSPISNLINKIAGVEYEQDNDGKKKLKVDFKTILNDAKETLDLPKQPLQAVPLPADPKQAIVDALNSLEFAAEEKLKELGIDYRQNGFKNTALVYLELRGSFPPGVEETIRSLKMLRDDITHYESKDISAVDANEYNRVAQKIKKIVEAIPVVPAVQLNAIVMILRNISCVIDTGKYNHITIPEIYEHIENETLLSFVAELDGAHELKGALSSNLYKGFDRFYTKSLLSIYYAYGGDHRRKWGIQNSGLCLALAWTIEIIQMGSGWHPNENLSEL